tara:strand:- start:114 stop:236 length:123 start_codon:yes stop_codon:yes gene_type:complete
MKDFFKSTTKPISRKYDPIQSHILDTDARLEQIIKKIKRK